MVFTSVRFPAHVSFINCMGGTIVTGTFDVISLLVADIDVAMRWDALSGDAVGYRF